MLEQKNLDSDFAPLDQLNQALRYWWFLFGLILIGGLVGLGIHQVRPPVYEAVGNFTASIDYVATGPLTQYDEDVALNAIGNVIVSRVVTDRVVSRAKAEGINIERADLSKMAVLERSFTTWDLRIRSTSAETAGRIATLWVEEGQAQLGESYEHALKAEQLYRYIQTLETCLGNSAASEPANVLCAQHRFAEIQADLRDAGKVLAQERKQSMSLFSGLVIGPEGTVSSPPAPVAFGRNQLVFFGGLVGLLLGFWLLFLGFPGRWLVRR